MPVKRYTLTFSRDAHNKDSCKEDNELNSQKAVLWKQIIEKLEECEKVWKTMEKEYNNLNHLMLKQTEVKDLCLMYMVATKQPCVRNAIKTPKIFNRIDQQGYQCAQKLELIRIKANKACEVINEFNRNMQAHTSSLMSGFTKIEEAKTLKELEKISMLNSDWILKTPAPETDDLTNEWTKAQLHSAILHVLQQLSQIVPGYVVMDLWKTVELRCK